jgi:transketolase
MDLLSPNIDTLCIDTVRWLADRFNRPGFKIVDHRTYAFSEDVGKRYEAYGWRVIRVADGEDLQALTQAFEEAARPCGKPTLISCRTIIGFPAPTRQNTAGAHGAPLGEPEISATKEILGFDPDGHFVVPAAAQDEWRKCETRGAGAETAWNALFERYRQAYPVLAAEFEAMMKGELVPDWESILPTFQPGEKYATREAGGKAINALAARTALEAEGIPTRVVSMPSWEIFQAQPAEYRQQVLPAAVAARVSIEAGVTLGWERWLGKGGAAIGLGSFGCSGPAETLFEQFGFTDRGIEGFLADWKKSGR